MCFVSMLITLTVSPFPRTSTESQMHIPEGPTAVPPGQMDLHGRKWFGYGVLCMYGV